MSPNFETGDNTVEFTDLSSRCASCQRTFWGLFLESCHDKGDQCFGDWKDSGGRQWGMVPALSWAPNTPSILCIYQTPNLSALEVGALDQSPASLPANTSGLQILKFHLRFSSRHRVWATIFLEMSQKTERIDGDF